MGGLLELHRRMFSPVWNWAGEVRKTETTIGVAPHQIQAKLHEFVQNVEHRVAAVDVDCWPELAAHSHHALVSIHAFANGNGRHSRLATDVLSWRLKQREPQWGDESLSDDGRASDIYIHALQQADRGDPKPLTQFMCSK